MREQRRAIHAYVTEEAFEGWHRYASEAGVTVSGLLEAIGTEFAALASAGHDMGEHQPDRLQAARRIDAANRRRGPDR